MVIETRGHFSIPYDNLDNDLSDLCTPHRRDHRHDLPRHAATSHVGRGPKHKLGITCPDAASTSISPDTRRPVPVGAFLIGVTDNLLG